MTNLVTVTFNDDMLFYVIEAGRQFVPVRPICEALGLAWQVQHRKLTGAQERWGVTMMVTPSAGGDQEMVCLPQSRLFGWLMTIHPSKVKPEVRAKLIAYQQECDDVLWRHWSGQRSAAEAEREALAASDRRKWARAERFGGKARMWMLQFKPVLGKIVTYHDEGELPDETRRALHLSTEEFDGLVWMLQNCGYCLDWPGSGGGWNEALSRQTELALEELEDLEARRALEKELARRSMAKRAARAVEASGNPKREAEIMAEWEAQYDGHPRPARKAVAHG